MHSCHSHEVVSAILLTLLLQHLLCAQDTPEESQAMLQPALQPVLLQPARPPRQPQPSQSAQPAQLLQPPQLLLQPSHLWVQPPWQPPQRVQPLQLPQPDMVLPPPQPLQLAQPLQVSQPPAQPPPPRAPPRAPPPAGQQQAPRGTLPPDGLFPFTLGQEEARQVSAAFANTHDPVSDQAALGPARPPSQRPPGTVVATLATLPAVQLLHRSCPGPHGVVVYHVHPALTCILELVETGATLPPVSADNHNGGCLDLGGFGSCTALFGLPAPPAFHGQQEPALRESGGLTIRASLRDDQNGVVVTYQNDVLSGAASVLPYMVRSAAVQVQQEDASRHAQHDIQSAITGFVGKYCRGGVSLTVRAVGRLMRSLQSSQLRLPCQFATGTS
jgi:hypothetical protein